MEDYGDEEELDWGELGNARGKYYECFSSTYNSFFYLNKETGHETLDEPEEQYYDIVRYCTGSEGRAKFWFPEDFPSPPQIQSLPPPEDVLDTDCIVIPPVATREASFSSVASLKDLACGVDLKSPYTTFLDHLRGCNDLDLSAWRIAKQNNSQQEVNQSRQERHSISICDEFHTIPPIQPHIQEELDLVPYPSRQTKRGLKIWGILGGTLAIIFRFRRK